MRAELAALHRDLGTTFIYVTHDQAEAMTMSNRIAVMMAGEILQCAPPDEIYKDPADVRVARFIGAPAINFLPAEIDGDGDVRLVGVEVGLRTSLLREWQAYPGDNGLAITQVIHDGEITTATTHYDDWKKTA